MEEHHALDKMHLRATLWRSAGIDLRLCETKNARLPAPIGPGHPFPPRRTYQWGTCPEAGLSELPGADLSSRNLPLPRGGVWTFHPKSTQGLMRHTFDHVKIQNQVSREAFLGLRVVNEACASEKAGHTFQKVESDAEEEEGE